MILNKYNPDQIVVIQSAPILYDSEVTYTYRESKEIRTGFFGLNKITIPEGWYKWDRNKGEYLHVDPKSVPNKYFLNEEDKNCYTNPRITIYTTDGHHKSYYFDPEKERDEALKDIEGQCAKIKFVNIEN